MIDGLVHQFAQAYNKYGMQLIADNYVLKTGAYIRLSQEGEIIWINLYDQKEGRQGDEAYEWFALRDYNSTLLAMNKPIDSTKKIHSNNYLTFFMKKDVLIGKDALDKGVLQESIDTYYQILENPRLKYKSKKKALELYDRLPNEVDIESVKKARNIVEMHLDSILNRLEALNFANYIKIFIDAPLELYQQEGERYYIPNVYNKNDYNVAIDHKVYGLTNNNMGLNAKKPYMEHKTRDNSIPYYIPDDAILMHKYFFDWLGTRKSGPLYIKEDSDFVTGLERELVYGDKGYYFLEIEQGMAPTIVDYDYIPVLEREESLLVRNIQGTLEIEDGKRFIAPDYSLNSLSAIEAEIDRLVFQGRLRYVYYQDAGDIKKIDPSMKQYLLATREGFKQYFRLGQKEGLRAALPYVPRAILKRLQGEGYSKWKAAQAMNVYIALMSERGGNEEMAGKIIQLRQQLNEKLVAGPTMDCENDEEFFYLSGQIISYMLDRSKSQSANHSMANAFLETKRPEQLVKEIRFAFMKYNHDISRNYKKFNQAMAMVQGYVCDQQKVDLAMLLTGYTASNMFYEKKGGNEDE